MTYHAPQSRVITGQMENSNQLLISNIYQLKINCWKTSRKLQGALTFHMHPFYTYPPEIFLHLCHTKLSCNLDLISISFDVSDSKYEKEKP